MVELLGAFLEANSRRSQIQVEEFKVSTDGFMLNLLNCLYELSIGKIPIDKVCVLKLLTMSYVVHCSLWSAKQTPIHISNFVRCPGFKFLSMDIEVLNKKDEANNMTNQNRR